MDIVALEEIKRLKYRYLRCVDLKLWDELEDTLAPEATAEYGTPSNGGPLRFTGRDAILDFLRSTLGPGIITTHAAGQPEIDIAGERATGTWSFTDTVLATEHNNTMIAGAAFYEDRYTRGADGAWRILHTGYTRTYEYLLPLGGLPGFKLTANHWADGLP
ncbi:nuclear transport factor 2 family protein [Prauserella cavernicola]|uniref:Nuclear transport factor 2 family protein n=1 Tax=Prauserella cavernicola TaxID=2800127 RepID=A0A934QRQ4_9PSEU|nr:nuclear transport factor 2 family protein [Prauserella cavernicola]MBK1785466.1 nuclear transport factor 2 family protein [Prauserella cavernicola]